MLSGAYTHQLNQNACTPELLHTHLEQLQHTKKGLNVDPTVGTHENSGHRNNTRRAVQESETGK